MRCSLSPADLTHTFWLCPCLNKYLSSVFQTLSEGIKILIKPCPLIAIFGISSESLTFTRNQSDIIAFTSLLACRRILLVWTSCAPPAVATWLRDVLFFRKLEKVKFTVKGSVQKFYLKWQPFVTNFENLKVMPED